MRADIPLSERTNGHQAAAITRAVCSYCGVGCGITVREQESGALAATGDSDHPANEALADGINVTPPAAAHQAEATRGEVTKVNVKTKAPRTNRKSASKKPPTVQELRLAAKARCKTSEPARQDPQAAGTRERTPDAASNPLATAPPAAGEQYDETTKVAKKTLKPRKVQKAKLASADAALDREDMGTGTSTPKEPQTDPSREIGRAHV